MVKIYAQWQNLKVFIVFSEGEQSADSRQWRLSALKSAETSNFRMKRSYDH